MISIKLIFIIAFTLLISCDLKCQNTIYVKSVSGKGMVYGDVSPNNAKEIALKDSKINALREAGIKENLKSYELMFSNQKNMDFNQFFTSNIQSEIQGGIKSYEIVSEKLICSDSLNIYFEIKINAEVIKYDSKPDPSFDFVVNGIKPSYNSPSKLNFNFKASKEGYLNIFLISDRNCMLLYPYGNQKNFEFKNDKIYDFPLNGGSYGLSTDLKPSESNKLIFLYTKTEIPFIKTDINGLTSEESIFSFIYSISPSERKVEYFPFIVFN